MLSIFYLIQNPFSLHNSMHYLISCVQIQELKFHGFRKVKKKKKVYSSYSTLLVHKAISIMGHNG
jgi:hypothetical protein